MDPTISKGVRKWLTNLDTAALADIGWGSSGGPSFRLADPSNHVPEPVDFGSLHVGDVAQQALSITNQAANGGFSERLGATTTVASGDATATGSFALLGPGSTDATSLVIGIDAANAGAKAGMVTIDFSSDAAGIMRHITPWIWVLPLLIKSSQASNWDCSMMWPVRQTSSAERGRSMRRDLL